MFLQEGGIPVHCPLAPQIKEPEPTNLSPALQEYVTNELQIEGPLDRFVTAFATKGGLLHVTPK